MGLKYGIHILRGVPRQAVHRNTPTVTPGVTARMIAQGYSVCPWNPDMYGVNRSAPGAQAYYDSLFALYAQWGVDFVKVDDIANTEFKPDDPYSAKDEIEMIRAAIDKCGRSMVLSLSPGPAPLEQASHLRANANMWRISGDFWDRSDALRKMFALCEKWYPHVSPGCWPDCDMLPLGTLQLTETDPRYRARKTRFTENEQRTVMNLWCMFRSPLMFGGALTEELMDEDTLALITNRELLEIDRSSTGNRPAESDENHAIWVCRDKNGNDIIAFFNLTPAPRTLTYDFGEDGIALYDLWSKETAPLSRPFVNLPLGPAESRVFRIIHNSEGA